MLFSEFFISLVLVFENLFKNYNKCAPKIISFLNTRRTENYFWKWINTHLDSVKKLFFICWKSDWFFLFLLTISWAALGLFISWEVALSSMVLPLSQLFLSIIISQNQSAILFTLAKPQLIVNFANQVQFCQTNWTPTMTRQRKNQIIF